MLAVLLLLAVFGVGIELGLTGLLPGFLRSLRGYDLVSSNVGLVIFLGGIAAGRVLLGLLSGRVRLLLMIRGLFAVAAVFSAVLFFVPLPPAGTVAALILTGRGGLVPPAADHHPDRDHVPRHVRDGPRDREARRAPRRHRGSFHRVTRFPLEHPSRLALGIFPLLAAAGFIVLTAGGKRIQARVGALQAQPNSSQEVIP